MNTTPKRRPGPANLGRAGALATRIVATLFPPPRAMRPVRQVAVAPVRRTVPRR